MRKLICIVVVLAVITLTPYFPFFHYGEADVRAAIEGTWRAEVGSRTVTFTVAQATESETHASSGWIPSAAACGDRRTLVRTAEACGDTTGTDMPLLITAVSGATGGGKGEIFVEGYNFRTGRMRIDLDGLVIMAEIDSAGRVERAWAFDHSEQHTEATLERVERSALSLIVY